MSKKHQNPTQKGTDALPSGTKQPTKLVVAGVGDPELRARVIAAYSGPLGKFHVKQAQMYGLSPAPNMKTFAMLPDAKMVYQNIQGNETLTLEVSPEKLAAIAAEVSQPWDFAIVDMVVPNGSDMYMIAMAGRKGEWISDEDAEWAGSIGYRDSRDPPVIECGSTTQGTNVWPEVASAPTTHQIFSVKVDLRNFSRAVEFDLRATAVSTVFDQVLIGYTNPYALWPSGVDHTEVIGDELLGSFTLDISTQPDEDEFPDIYTPAVETQWPDMSNWLDPWVFDGGSNNTYELFYEDDSGYVTRVRQHVLVWTQTSSGASPVPGYVSRYYYDQYDRQADFFYVPMPIYQSQLRPLTPPEAELRVTFFRSRDDWLVNQINLGDFNTVYTQWETEASYPRRPVGTQFGSVTIGAEYDATADDGTTAKLLGRVTLDRVIGAGAFKPA